MCRARTSTSWRAVSSCAVVPIIRCSRRQPLQVTTEMVLDWQRLSQELGVLRIRTSELGEQVNWKRMAQIEVRRGEERKLFFKTSHLSEDFDAINLNKNRRSQRVPFDLPSPSRSQPPMMTSAKHQDLMSLCTGDIPVIRQPDHRNFYSSLPHSSWLMRNLFEIIGVLPEIQ